MVPINHSVLTASTIEIRALLVVAIIALLAAGWWCVRRQFE